MRHVQLCNIHKRTVKENNEKYKIIHDNLSLTVKLAPGVYKPRFFRAGWRRVGNMGRRSAVEGGGGQRM